MFWYIFAISTDFFAVICFSGTSLRNAGHGAHGGDGPRWHGGAVQQVLMY